MRKEDLIKKELVSTLTGIIENQIAKVLTRENFNLKDVAIIALNFTCSNTKEDGHTLHESVQTIIVPFNKSFRLDSLEIDRSEYMVNYANEEKLIYECHKPIDLNSL